MQTSEKKGSYFGLREKRTSRIRQELCWRWKDNALPQGDGQAGPGRAFELLEWHVPTFIWQTTWVRIPENVKIWCGWGDYNSCSSSLPLRWIVFFLFLNFTCISYLKNLLISSSSHSSCFEHGLCSSLFMSCPSMINMISSSLALSWVKHTYIVFLQVSRVWCSLFLSWHALNGDC